MWAPSWEPEVFSRLPVLIDLSAGSITSCEVSAPAIGCGGDKISVSKIGWRGREDEREKRREESRRGRDTMQCCPENPPPLSYCTH